MLTDSLVKKMTRYPMSEGLTEQSGCRQLQGLSCLYTPCAETEDLPPSYLGFTWVWGLTLITQPPDTLFLILTAQHTVQRAVLISVSFVRKQRPRDITHFSASCLYGLLFFPQNVIR